MSRQIIIGLLVLFSGSAAAQNPEPLVTKVKLSIDRGVEYLIRAQRKDGSWEDIKDDKDRPLYQGGPTALSVLALLNTDGVSDDPQKNKERQQAIQRGLANLRKLDAPTRVYVRALQTMALAEAKTKADLPLIKANVQWLLDTRVYKDGRFIGWTYDKHAGAASSDASNSQYAMLALWYARQAGVTIDRKVWQEIHDYYVRTQHKDGSWIYSSDYSPEDEKGASATMTVAGLCGLLIAGQELQAGAHACGKYGDDLPIALAQNWLNKKFGIDLQRQRVYYHLYGLERAGRLSGLRFFGEHDWYREGCEYLVSKQETNGAWPTRGGWDRWPHVNTSFALLFLSRGRTPVVISKLVHGNWPRAEWDTDWNNDRNDLRNLTDHVSRGELFERKTLAWQTYDVMRALHARNLDPKLEDETAVVADMRQSPILYLTGHLSPLGRIQGHENRIIKRFVDTGGLLFAEACCGDKRFDEGIKEWVKENWPSHELTYLESTHPVWTCFNPLPPGEPFKLMGLQVGCRTIMLYSPQDLSCHWESNKYSDGITKRAFELGENIIAYGTGRMAPQPRLTPSNILSEPPASAGGAKPSKRGFFQVGQIHHQGEWQPAPKAMNNLLTHVNKLAGLDVYLKTDQILLSDTSTVRGSKFLYMHGRKEFRVDPGHLDALRFTLENGGLLLADACCGSETFDKSFRHFAQALFPKEKLTPLSTDPKTRDRLFGPELNGTPLTAANIQCRVSINGKMLSREPYLEGIQVKGRWGVLYSKYDLGCALEGGASPGCVGYDQASALRIATAAVLYNARP